MANWYLWVKALHIIAVIAWMAAMLYLPRLFVYHVGATKGSAQSEIFKVMERRLLRFIALPAMVVVWITGPLLAWEGGYLLAPWFHGKLLLVLIMTGMHGWFSRMTKDFAADKNQHSQKFFRIINEVPTVLMIFIVILVVVKPF